MQDSTIPMIREVSPRGEPRPTRIKRLRMRSMRRGTKEMDILLVRFADAELDHLSDADLNGYEAILAENDQDLYRWISGQVAPPDRLAAIVADIRRIATPG